MRDLATHQILNELYGRPTFLQSVSATTTAARSAAIQAGSRLLIQCQGATSTFLKVGDSGVTATLAGCLSLSPAEKFYCCLTMEDTHVSVITGSGSTTVNIFLME